MEIGRILTKEEVMEIQSDIRKLIRPSWLTSVPANLGQASHGKLKADQWRALGTIFLPVSLLRLWSNVKSDDNMLSGTNSRSIRCLKILEITLHLVSAVTVATSRTTSSTHAAAYFQHMLAYLEGLKELFPDYKFTANHHFALHLYEFIKFFGPVHSWWTFPFERVIGMLQRISTNYKLGKYLWFIVR